MFEKLGKFEIKRLLGHGAMGEVYLGVDPGIGREVAIKTILATAAQGAEAKQRFEREAKAAGVLNHPNLVTIYEFGEDQGVLFIAMEYVKGHDLEELYREQSLSHSEALEVLAQVCDGLSFAHRNGIVHRDIKPSNVRVYRDGKRLHAKVMDFGVARVSNSDMTATGMVMGTVSYMAPEYIKTGKPDPRSDLFAVGVMLYECLSGRKPFSGDTTPTILYKIVNEAPEPLDAHNVTGISPVIRTVLERVMTKDPDIRYQTADELAKALRAAKDPTWQGQAEEGTTLVKASGSVAMSPAPVPPTVVVPTPSMIPQPGEPIPPPVPVAYTAPVVPPRKPSRVLPMVLAGFAGLVLLGGAGYAAVKWRQSTTGAESETTSKTTTMGEEAKKTPEDTPKAAEQMTPSGTGATSRVAPAGKPSETNTSSVSVKQETNAEASPTPRKTETAPTQPNTFSQENLGEMQVHERKNLAHLTMSEAISLADSDPKRAVEGLRDAIAANPGNANAYAWLVAVLYEQKRYGEIPAVLAKARQHGISRSQLMSNMRFRMAMQRDNMDRRIPGGAE